MASCGRCSARVENHWWPTLKSAHVILPIVPTIARDRISWFLLTDAANRCGLRSAGTSATVMSAPMWRPITSGPPFWRRRLGHDCLQASEPGTRH